MRFDNEHDEYIYGITMDGAMQNGDVEAPSGWFAHVDLSEDEEPAVLAHYSSPHLLVQENSDGFVTVTAFETTEARGEAYGSLERAYWLWDSGITPADAVEAINGYRQAAEFTGGSDALGEIDGLGLEWSVEAQHAARNDVIQFITSNADDCRAFIESTRIGWLQVGIDFWLARGHHGADFSDREGVGPEGERLVTAAEAYTDRPLYVGDDNLLYY